MRIDIKGPIVNSNRQWVYDWLGMEATSPKKVEEILGKANGEPIEVEVNSGGGEIFAASEIYTALKNYAGNVTIRIVGLAASAASVIAMAGESEIASTAMMMIHNVQSSEEGDCNAMEHMANVLRSANQAIATAYIAKTGKTEKEILRMMEDETWVTADEAVSLGLVDKIMERRSGQKPMAAAWNSGMLSEEAVGRIENLAKSQSKSTGFLAAGRERAQTKYNFLKLKGEVK